MKVNILVRLWFYLTLAISVLMVPSPAVWTGYLAVAAVLLYLNRGNAAQLGRRLKPYLFFLPVMIILYTGFSLLLTADNLVTIVNQGLFAFIKLVLMITIMNIYFLRSSDGEILCALRSLWRKTGLSWRFMEDLFLYLELTLRFFPTFQHDWEQLRESRQALGLNHSGKRLGTIKQAATDLPSLLLRNLSRADEIAHSVVMRGYGQTIPRGVAHPVVYTIVDLLLFLTIAIIFYLLNFHVTV